MELASHVRGSAVSAEQAYLQNVQMQIERQELRQHLIASTSEQSPSSPWVRNLGAESGVPQDR